MEGLQLRRQRNLWGKSKPRLSLLLFLKEVQLRLGKGRARGLIIIKTSMEYCRHMSHGLILLADKNHQLVRVCNYSLPKFTSSE